MGEALPPHNLTAGPLIQVEFAPLVAIGNHHAPVLTLSRFAAVQVRKALVLTWFPSDCLLGGRPLPLHDFWCSPPCSIYAHAADDIHHDVRLQASIRL